MSKSKELDIIYEDESLICVNKPAGLLTIPDRFNTNAPSVISILSKQFETVIPVHRLDKNTSGVVLFAKSAEMHKKMSLLFENREVAKYYVAIVDGRVVPTEGIIHAPLAESMTQRGKMVINKRGKESTTEYKVITQFKRFAYVSLKLLTGRMHQIRVHMLHIGHPLVVDHLYGNRENLCLSEIKQKRFNIGKFEEEKPILMRQPLHAQRLEFMHPDKEVLVKCEAELPKDMFALLRQLEKWDVLK
ncbi:MAG: RluA family pseudouridine synthase [Saprospiraceae bacterium]|nr:RluA family pseudouridine synthase [Saprospiraceae bacterium]MBK6566833.1 RluA family pseudouridine synthase [Saprospiraceae bacterium]MBK8081563.1 RluA family pseudouridine synthase [Saprospiraceae bacterium]MBK8371019.1 RluA family pseudouridine synthase [Saprospiraceae bacterium]MBK8854353.1 RluA family pseudouridine synthase [Saprospiraceae bacterium]